MSVLHKILSVLCPNKILSGSHTIQMCEIPDNIIVWKILCEIANNVLIYTWLCVDQQQIFKFFMCVSALILSDSACNFVSFYAFLTQSLVCFLHFSCCFITVFVWNDTRKRLCQTKFCVTPNLHIDTYGWCSFTSFLHK